VADNIKQSWIAAWQDKGFKKKLFIGLILTITVLVAFPIFFHFIENRDGYSINDPILKALPATDLSIPTFTCIWLVGALMLIRSIQSPALFLQFIWAFFFLCIFRIITIGTVALNPPAHLIPLMDPLSNKFYGGTYVTKDLFFSGHTSTQFLMFLLFTRKSDKTIALLSSIVVGIMVLIQHVHYTVDVLAAFPFTYIVYWLSRKVTN